MHNKTLAALLLAGFSAGALAAKPTLDMDAYRQAVKTLASDDFEGRAPLSAGETKTINYLKAEFAKAGLSAGYNGQYFQPVEMGSITANQDMTLRIGDMAFKPGSEFVARTQKFAPQTALKDSELVFVGYGIHAPEAGWDDYAGVDVKGKTVIVLVNDPGFATQDPKVFRGNTMTYYGRWTYKYEEAIRQGAAGALIVHETAPAAYPWGVVESGAVGERFTLVDDTDNAHELDVMGWLQKASAEQILKAAGQDYARLKAAAAKPGFKAVDLGLKANLKVNNTLKKATSHNVVGLIKGSKYPDEYLVVSAHWDHLGRNPNLEGDQIFNGAVDNATGAAALISLAQAFKAHRPERSVLFVAFTGEEQGLLGAKAFAAAPPVPTRQMVALLNMDGMNVSGKVDYALLFGRGQNSLEQYLTEGAKAQQRGIKDDPKPQDGYYFRSDHFALAHKGVPGLLFMSLGANSPDYIAHRYHKPSDEYSDSWDLSGTEADLQLIFGIADKLANSRDWPKWYPGSEFKAARDQDQQH
ncbi:M28 family metallopeptidase [Gallaecimonas xiamenensis]|uniref:Peptidase M28 n=1 Tax=Gallaecimonas xiamenensis 3-C-1 TaxID=745411 RepID=K2IKG4_9GAMM|nr:M28 family metallopeptidase [Gallaecimonas xiamenensis]EKE70621.1 peptidase M28 [Gallaecimonas xiamenensis 3-C-1]